MNINLEERTVADVVAENIKNAHVFKKHSIDFCCGGGISLKEACEKKGVNIDQIKEELDKVDRIITKNQDYNSWNLDFLIDHIINIHHSYVLESIPLISQYSARVAKVHGVNHPETVRVYELFADVANELNMHLRKEENILFPYIKKLVSSTVKSSLPETPGFGTVNNPIKMMEQEHELAGETFKEISRLTNQYTPPAGACNTFRALYSKLEEFEEDLHQHIHLENNILFPKATALENQLVTN